MMLDGHSDQVVRRRATSDIDMSDCKLVSWHGLPIDSLHKVFPDVVHLGDMDVEFESTEMAIYRYKDAVGNSAFAFDKGNGLVSHGSQILTSQMVSDLRTMGARVS
jgi:hypothetical protein